MRVSWILALAATACAGHDGAWPTLARRSIEGAPVAVTGPCARQVTCLPGSAALPDQMADTAAGTNPAAAETAAPGVPAATLDDATAKLTVIAGDADDAAARLAAQRAVATAAASAARGSPPNGPAWAKAELERTALDRIGDQIDGLRQRLDGVAGTLAAAAAGGSDVAAPLATTGRLIARTTALHADYIAAAAALQ